MKNLITALLFALSIPAFSDELIEIPSTERGFLSNSDPTKAMLWDDSAGKGVVVFFPGGDGNLKMDWVWPRYRMSGIGKTVTIIPNMSGAFINSPYSLGFTYSASGRFTNAHIERMVSALQTIKTKTNKPLWIYGHSNGSISSFEVYAYLQKENRADLISGIIVSGARDIVRIPQKIDIPVLFIHHRDDACADTPYDVAQRSYQKVKERSSAKTEFVTVTTYIQAAGNPCLTGVHMFDGAYNELAVIISEFIKTEKPLFEGVK